MPLSVGCRSCALTSNCGFSYIIGLILGRQQWFSMSSIPALDLTEVFDPTKRNTFLRHLRHAVIEIGFFALINFSELGPSSYDFEVITEEANNFSPPRPRKRLN